MRLGMRLTVVTYSLAPAGIPSGICSGPEELEANCNVEEETTAENDISNLH